MFYRMHSYDSNAETEVRKYGAKHLFCALLATMGRAQVAKTVKCASKAQANAHLEISKKPLMRTTFVPALATTILLFY